MLEARHLTSPKLPLLLWNGKSVEDSHAIVATKKLITARSEWSIFLFFRWCYTLIRRFLSHVMIQYYQAFYLTQTDDTTNVLQLRPDNTPHISSEIKKRQLRRRSGYKGLAMVSPRNAMRATALSSLPLPWPFPPFPAPAGMMHLPLGPIMKIFQYEKTKTRVSQDCISMYFITGDLLVWFLGLQWKSGLMGSLGLSFANTCSSTFLLINKTGDVLKKCRPRLS